jgi:hypothetical protein
VKHGEYAAAVAAYTSALALEEQPEPQRAVWLAKRAYCRQQTADWSDW